MKVSQFPLATVKETPADAEIVSHQLMMRAGMIKKIAAGIYSWQPLGLQFTVFVLRQVAAVGTHEQLMRTSQAYRNIFARYES